jgi:predicted DCC family thiol-disulfide oxidoreductase YuxK
VYYDADCVLCRLAVERCRRGDPEGRIAFRAIDVSAAAELGVALEALQGALHVRKGDRVLRGVFAVGQVLRQLRRGRVAGWAVEWSGRLLVGAIAYSLLARHRHRLGRLWAGLPAARGER